MPHSSRVLFGFACAMALVLGPLSLLGSPAQAGATGVGTWSLDGGPGQLGFDHVDTISCPDPTYCVALESTQDQDPSLIWSAGTWHTAPLVEPGGALQLNSVSCSSESFCMAVGERSLGSGIGSGVVGVIEEWDGSAWSMVANPQSSGANVWLSSVSCPSASNCFAAGQDNTDGGLIDSWDGVSWTMAFNQQVVSLSAVSCTNSTTCVTVGDDTTTNSLYSVVLAGGVWTPESVPDPGNWASLSDVSCGSPTFCMAVGSVRVGDVGWATGLTEDWDGVSWAFVPSPNYPEDDLGPGFIGGGILNGVSCISAQACVAVGYGGGGQNSSALGYPILAVVETWDGIAWSLTPTPAPVEPTGTAGQAPLRGVSCVPDANDAECVAVGLQSPGNENLALVETTSAAVGSLDATSTQVQSDGAGDLTATVTTDTPAQDTTARVVPHISGGEATPDISGGAAMPTGSVTFMNDGLPIPGCPPLELDSGQASCSAGAGATGPITADYSGDATFDGSSGQVGTLPVTYVGNGATSGTVPVDSASPYSSSATVTVLGPDTLLRSGYTFSGWNTKPDGSGSSYAPGATFTILAGTELFAVWTPTPPPVTQPTTPPVTQPTTPPVTQPATQPPASHGYWLVGSDGGIFPMGSAQFYGSAGSLHLQRPVVGIVPTKDDEGYWLDASDGGVFSYGDTQFHGSIPGLGIHPYGSGLPESLDAPIVGMVPSADDGGYFMVGSDGGVFAFGDAKFAGSCPGIGGCSGAAVAVMPDASGGGYWVVTKTGNVYAFGDAPSFGSPGPQSSPVTSAVRTPDGKGYWILFANGEVANFGDALNFGGPAGQFGGLNPAAAIFTTADGAGYWVAGADGAVTNYGDAPSDGSMLGTHLNGSIIAGTGW
jgi:hypothetical protein